MILGSVPLHLKDHTKVFLYLELIRQVRELNNYEKHKYFIVRRALVEHGLLNRKAKYPTEEECRAYGLKHEYYTYMYNAVNPVRYKWIEAY